MDAYEASDEEKERLSKGIQKGREHYLSKADAFIREWIVNPDGGIASEAGQGTSSVLMSMGLAGLMGGNTAAFVYGTSQAAEIYHEARNAGKTGNEALMRAIPAGIAEGGLEKIGLDNLFAGLKSKGWKGMIKFIVPEAMEEAAQTGAEELIMKDIRGTDAEEIIDRMAESFGMTVVTQMLLFGTQRTGKAALSFTAKGQIIKRAENLGVDPRWVQEWMDKADAASFRALDSAIREKRLGDLEAYLTEKGMKPEQIKKAKEMALSYEKEMAQNYKELSDEFLERALEATDEDREASLKAAEEWALSETDIRGKVREDFIKAGISGQNAEAAASLMQAGMEAMAQLSGTTPLQEYENFHLSIQNQSEALKTDTEEQTVQMSPEEAEALEPLTQEEERYIRSLMEQQEQAKAAQTMQAPESGVMSLEDTLGYYQIAQKIQKTDREKLDFERKDIRPEVLARGKEKVKAVQINRFFADKKTSKDISLKEVMSALDKTAQVNENGVRILKNDNGETVSLSNRSVSEMYSSSSQRDGRNIGGILGKEVIANLPEIFKGAFKIKETPDIRHQSPNRIIRYANAIESDGKPFIVKITVKEMANNRQELTDIEIEGNAGKDLAAYDVKVGRKNTAEGNISTNKSVAIPGGTDIIIDDLIDYVNSYSAETVKIDGKERSVRNSQGERIAKTEEGLRAFYEWFGDSKAVDENGRPLVVYHGTDKEFFVFKPQDIHSFSEGIGNFFSSREDIAQTYGKKTYPVYLKMENPLIVDYKGKYFNEIMIVDGQKMGVIGNYLIESVPSITDIAKHALAKGYDGVIAKNIKDSADPYEILGKPDEKKIRELVKLSDEELFARYIKVSPGLNDDIKVHLKDLHNRKERKFIAGVVEQKEREKRNSPLLNADDYVVFSPNQIKSVYNRGSFSRTSDNIYYQREQRYNQRGEEVKDLYATHNINLAGIESAIKLGGLAMPSLALRKVSQGNINQFGEIVLVANEKLATPRRGIDVYDRDAWTPSIGQKIRYDLLPAGKDFIKSILEKNGRERELSVFLYNIGENIRYPESNNMAMELYALDKGLGEDYKVYEVMNSQEYIDWYNNNIMKNAEPYLWTENARNTDMVRKELTLNNIMSILKKQEKESGAWLGEYPGVNELLSFFVYKFRNLKEVKKRRHKLVSKEEQREAIARLEDDFGNLVEKIADINEESYMDSLQKVASVIIDTDVPVTEKMQKWGLKSPEGLSEAVEKLRDEIKNIPTDYFEVKPRRVVDFSEFSGVIIPKGKKYDEVAKVLEKEHFLNVERAENGNEQEYAQALNNIQANSSTVFFQDQVEEPTGVRGYFEMGDKAGQIIQIMKSGDVDTMVHELMHFFTLNRIMRAQAVGQEGLLQGLKEYYGVEDANELLRRDIAEDLADKAMVYLTKEEAPTSFMRRFFESFKRWLERFKNALIRHGMIKDEELSPKIREFFDGMFSLEGKKRIALESIRGQEASIREVLQKAVKGEAVSFEDKEGNKIDIRQIRELLSVRNKRAPKAPLTLAQKLRQAGGVEKSLAQKFGWDEALGAKDSVGGGKNNLFIEGGKIKNENDLIGFLRQEGFISEEQAQEADIAHEMMNDLMEKAQESYSPADLEQLYLRENILEAREEADKILQGIDYFEAMQALDALKGTDKQVVDEDILRGLKKQVKELGKAYEKYTALLMKEKAAGNLEKRRELLKLLDSFMLEGEDKYRLSQSILKAGDNASFEKLASEIARRGRIYAEKRMKHIYRERIGNLLKQSKPNKVTQQRYDYENNVLFRDLREYNGLTKEEAKERQEEIFGQAPYETLTEQEKIRYRFLEYKKQGMESSPSLMGQVAKDLSEAMKAGRAAKTEEEFARKMERNEEAAQVLAALNTHTNKAGSLRTISGNIYRRGVANLWSLLNSITNKKTADKYEFETLQTEVDTRVFLRTQEAINKAMDVFGLKKKDLMDFFVQEGKEEEGFALTNKKTQVSRNLSRMEIMDIYNAIKNDKVREDYFEAYGQRQVEYLVGMLSDEEKAFADWMRTKAQSYYDKYNEVYIQLYGIDLKKAENYWPATSEHYDPIQIEGDYKNQSSVPSALKERARGRVVPVPKNAWEKYARHFTQAEYITGLGLDYMNVKRVFANALVKDTIEKKFGKGVYRDLMEDIETLSLNRKMETIDAANGLFNLIRNNWVVSKIGLNMSVFLKQLTSLINYMEGMPADVWAKYFAEGIAHPKQTWQEMTDEMPFIRARIAQGNNEAMMRAMQSDAVWKKKGSYTQAMTALTRYGDGFAVIYGGYPYYRWLKEQGDGDAARKFEFATLRSQQSGAAVSLSPLQRSRGKLTLFLAFKNASMQFTRKMTDATINYARGEITGSQYAKIMFLYLVANPVLVTLAGVAASMLYGGSDDDDDLTDKLLEQVLLNPVEGYIVASDVARYAYRRATGQPAYNVFSTPVLDDMERIVRSLSKKEPSGWDMAQAAWNMGGMMAGLPAYPFNVAKSHLKEEKKKKKRK